MTDASTCPRCGMPHPRCSAHAKSTGGPCMGMPVTGATVCRVHGANKNVRAAGKRRTDEARAQLELRTGLAAAYGDDVPDIPPAEAMIQAVSWKYAEVLALRAKVAELDDDDRVWGTTREKSGGDDHGTTAEAKPNIWWTMLREAERDLVKFAAAARAAGCDEARVRLAEREGALVEGVIRRILIALNLTDDQQLLVGTVVPRELRALAGGDAA